MSRKHSPVKHHSHRRAIGAIVRSGYRHLVITPLVLMLLAVSPVKADDATRLQQLRQKIAALEADINSTQQHRSETYQRLVSVERQLNGMHRELRKLEKKLAQARQALKKSEHAQANLKSDMGKQRTSVAQHVRTAYLLGSQAQIKLLLNQQRVDDVSRAMAYYRYLTGARLQRIDAMQTSLDQQQRIARQVSRQQSELEQLRQQKQAESDRINEVVKERKLLLAKLDRQLQQSGSRLQGLREDERRLERLVSGIQQANRPPLAPAGKTGNFGSQRKRLRLPVEGRIIARFGNSKHIGDQRWNGLFIAAADGRNVHAIYAGRVVFAGWLHGFGMLMILDHGDGYMSLYGHNRSLYKGVGDWVETDDVIASVGNTGNPPRTGLYFGVRQAGKPQNPLIWCRAGR